MDDIWDLLKEYDFLLTNIVSIDYICILCKKILIDPIIGPCGCRYCKLCIENYLTNGVNICPGSTDECKKEYLNLTENINIDYCFNKKMAKIKLYCPIESCSFSDQIINMKQHLIVCKEDAIKCPLFENGCNFISLSKDNVDKHCKMSKDIHLELVLTKIENMNNIIDSINKNKNNLQQEIESLKKENANYKQSLKQNQVIFKELEEQSLIQTKKNDDQKAKYENQIKYKNNLIKYLSEFLIGNQTKFTWKISNLAEIKTRNKIVSSDKFYIHKKIIYINLSMNYDKFNYNYQLTGKLSHNKPSLNSCCPFTFNITVEIFNEYTGNFIVSFDEKQTFDGSLDAVSFNIKLYDYQICDEITNDCLILKCLVRLSV